jgi:hypothetical protein
VQQPELKSRIVQTVVAQVKFVARVKAFSDKWLRLVRVANVVVLDKQLHHHA